ncbi:hypothetical protein P43SY_002232 [Pythium insidiosum]|uniref:PX domain-containing protein n=1 Tax=Pythium insidiosum TaxID=114742 RepID=A0AAD5MBD3_PYTIN|nr:hypothetical protein P43SY_002232 [Pythium insidiosum]
MPDIPAVRSHPVVRPAGLQVGADKVTLVMGGTAVERSMVTIGSLVICNVRPVGGSAFSRYTLYAVHVQNAITGRSWVVHRRYSEFLAFRELIREHFEQHCDLFPKIHAIVEDLYFPRKHRIRSNTGRVVQHRCSAFLQFLVVLHRLLISQKYQQFQRICAHGVSILRGFLGSSVVQDPLHSSIYEVPGPILQTVVELDNEDDENVDELKSKCQLAAEDSASATCSDTDSQRTLSEHEEPDVDGCPDASALEINKLGVDILIKQAMMSTANGASSPSTL